MASGTIAPISTSKGPDIDVPPHQFQYPGEANAQVVVYATQRNAAAGLAKYVVEAAAAAIKEKGSFTLVLSGVYVEGGLWECAGCGRSWAHGSWTQSSRWLVVLRVADVCISRAHCRTSSVGVKTHMHTPAAPQLVVQSGPEA